MVNWSNTTIKLYATDRSRWMGGLAIILLVYSAYYIFFVDMQGYYEVNRKMRHIIKFGTTIFVYLIGTYHLGKLKVKWMSLLWHTIHISFLCCITSIGIYDWTFGMVSNATKEVAATMQEFLISPVLYVAMRIIDKRLNKDQVL